MSLQQADRWRERRVSAGSLVLKSDPYIDPQGEGSLEFRLTYEGQLLSDREAPSRNVHKHDIRKQIHPQLRLFWNTHPYLQHLQKLSYEGSKPKPGENAFVEELASMHVRANGFRFVPLVREELALLCSLEILYLRPANPGSIIHDGDIDNRLKTIFDALSIPDGQQVPPGPPEFDPFFVLLANDKLVTHISVATDFLLKGIDPTRPIPDQNDARVVITVNLRPYVQRMGAGTGNMGFT